MLTIAAFIFAAAGWLAFAKEWRAHRETKYAADCLDDQLAQRAPPTHPNTES